jgi:phosphatidylserine decarboxylase
MVQVAGLVARRIICRLEPGDLVKAGSRFGLICFGSRVDLYLPPETVPAVEVGDKVKAGLSVLGTLN